VAEQTSNGTLQSCTIVSAHHSPLFQSVKWRKLSEDLIASLAASAFRALDNWAHSLHILPLLKYL
jgi:hypothetical protein